MRRAKLLPRVMLEEVSRDTFRTAVGTWHRHSYIHAAQPMTNYCYNGDFQHDKARNIFICTGLIFQRLSLRTQNCFHAINFCLFI